MWPANSLEPNHDPHVRQWIERYLAQGDVFYDFGANVGQMSLLAAERGGTVYAFEPLPSAAIQIPEHPGITVVTAAVGAAVGLWWMELAPDSQHAEVMGLPYPWLTLSRRLMVPVFGPEDLKAFLPKPHMVKSDTQGCEVIWLGNVRDMLSDCHTMILECNEECLNRHGTTVGQLMRIISDLDYNVVEKIGEDLLCRRL